MVCNVREYRMLQAFLYGFVDSIASRIYIHINNNNFDEGAP